MPPGSMVMLRVAARSRALPMRLEQSERAWWRVAYDDVRARHNGRCEWYWFSVKQTSLGHASTDYCGAVCIGESRHGSVSCHATVLATTRACSCHDRSSACNTWFSPSVMRLRAARIMSGDGGAVQLAKVLVAEQIVQRFPRSWRHWQSCGDAGGPAHVFCCGECVLVSLM